MSAGPLSGQSCTLGAEDLLGKLAGARGGVCLRTRGAGCQRAVDEQEELAGGMPRLLRCAASTSCACVTG